MRARITLFSKETKTEIEVREPVIVAEAYIPNAEMVVLKIYYSGEVRTVSRSPLSVWRLCGMPEIVRRKSAVTHWAVGRAGLYIYTRDGRHHIPIAFFEGAKDAGDYCVYEGENSAMWIDANLASAVLSMVYAEEVF